MLEKYQKEFLYPDNEFSPVPFWFWNDTLSKAEIKRQIYEFKKKGVDGFVIHPRIGLPLQMKYLSDEFMEYVEFAVQCAADMEMKVVLYDEAMYPSGSAHGEVVRCNPAFASKGLKMVSEYKQTQDEKLIAAIDIDVKTGERIEAKGPLIEGYNRWYFIMKNSGGTIRGIHFGEDDGEPNAPKSADLLNPQAVKCFIKLTHERYYECLSKYFGNTIIAMFTDEPMILGRCAEEGLIEWTDDFLDYYIEHGGRVIDLPLLFKNEESKEKNNYKKSIKKLLGNSFYSQISSWCKAHHIGLTGHPESSQDIGLLKYFDIPCQDIVWRFVEPMGDKGVVGEHSTMAKCSSDSARHHNKLRNGNECFGCCGAKENPYVLSREDMKWYLDWLFVRGVNMIYPHAFFYSMRDKRKDERPPDVGMHSMFWDEYHEVTDYIKRMSQLLTGSVNQTEIAILCTEDSLNWKVAKVLFENQIEFNYLEEDLISSSAMADGFINIGEQSYHVLIADTITDNSVQSHLAQFQKAGGIVIKADSESILEEISLYVHRDMFIKPINKNLRKTHIRKGNIDFIILTNEGEERIDTQLHLTAGKIIELWDAEEGTINKHTEGPDTLRLNLARRKSLILVVEP